MDVRKELKAFSEMNLEEKQKTIEGLQARENEHDAKEIKQVQVRARSSSHTSSSSFPALSSEGHESKEDSSLIFYPDERAFLRGYIQEEAKAAKNLRDLNDIYDAHSTRAYVSQHRRGNRYRLDYTETKTILINELRRRATEIYNPAAESEEMKAIAALKSAELVPEADLDRQPEELKRFKGKSSPSSSAATFSLISSGRESKDGEQLQSSPLRSRYLHFLLTREKELPKARFVSKEHDTWLKQALKTIGGILYAPIGWVYHPTAYSQADKLEIRNELEKEIKAACTFTDLMKIYDRYKDAEFVKERRYGALLADRAYSLTRTTFITKLREQAVQLDNTIYNKKSEDSISSNPFALTVEQSTDERRKLLDHAIFATAHEGTPKLGGVSTEHREALEASQRVQLGLRNSERAKMVLSS